MKKNLVILCNAIPGSKKHFENWLKDELNLTYKYYNRITIFPTKFTDENVELPYNCDVVDITKINIVKLNLWELFNSLKIVLLDYILAEIFL